MSRNSSTSSSSPRSYLTWLVGGALGFSAVIAGLNFAGERFNLIDHKFYANYHFQLAKLAEARGVETLFVGDSSLGAFFDSKTWAEESGGRPAMHLALTGSYGYAGSLNMVRRAAQRLRLRNVVVVHSADMMTRPVAYLGYLQSMAQADPVADVPLGVRVIKQTQFYFNSDILVGTLRGIALGGLGISRDYFDREYIRIPAVVGAPAELAGRQAPVIKSGAINPAKTLFLRRLSEFCANNGLNCLYAHGPLFVGTCRTSKDYFREVTRIVESIGMRMVARTPVCVPRKELADAIDHVRPDLKGRYTKSYFELIAPYLR